MIQNKYSTDFAGVAIDFRCWNNMHEKQRMARIGANVSKLS